MLRSFILKQIFSPPATHPSKHSPGSNISVLPVPCLYSWRSGRCCWQHEWVPYSKPVPTPAPFSWLSHLLPRTQWGLFCLQLPLHLDAEILDARKVCRQPRVLPTPAYTERQSQRRWQEKWINAPHRGAKFPSPLFSPNETTNIFIVMLSLSAAFYLFYTSL